MICLYTHRQVHALKSLWCHISRTIILVNFINLILKNMHLIRWSEKFCVLVLIVWPYAVASIARTLPHSLYWVPFLPWKVLEKWKTSIKMKITIERMRKRKEEKSLSYSSSYVSCRFFVLWPWRSLYLLSQSTSVMRKWRLVCLHLPLEVFLSCYIIFWDHRNIYRQPVCMLYC